MATVSIETMAATTAMTSTVMLTPMNHHVQKKTMKADFKPILMTMYYKLIPWPEVQELMEREGFQEHSSLAYETDKFGSQAYFIELQWLKQINELKAIEDEMEQTNN